jgi:NADH-quinone oxidoreductase subunit C
VNATELANKLREKFEELVSAPAEFRGEITVNVADAERIVEVCEFAKKELGFDYLVDVSSVDNYGDDPRWTIVYELYGLAHRCYLRLKTNVSEEKSELPTVTGVWRTADWHEREIYDMMGVRFRGHPDLRRILLPEDWEGYPLRRDYPVEGFRDVPSSGDLFKKSSML